MSAVRLSDCDNVPKCALKIQSDVNDFNLCASINSSSTGSGLMPKRGAHLLPDDGYTEQ